MFTTKRGAVAVVTVEAAEGSAAEGSADGAAVLDGWIQEHVEVHCHPADGDEAAGRGVGCGVRPAGPLRQCGHKGVWTAHTGVVRGKRWLRVEVMASLACRNSSHHPRSRFRDSRVQMKATQRPKKMANPVSVFPPLIQDNHSRKSNDPRLYIWAKI